MGRPLGARGWGVEGGGGGWLGSADQGSVPREGGVRSHGGPVATWTGVDTRQPGSFSPLAELQGSLSILQSQKAARISRHLHQNELKTRQFGAYESGRKMGLSVRIC